MTAAEESDDADGVVVDVMKEGDSDAEEAAAKGVNSKKDREEVLLVDFV